LKGDFNDDPTFWSDVGQIVTGFVPIAGQLGDLRDLVKILDEITNQEGYKQVGKWATLVLTVVGFVPGVGDALSKLGRKGLKALGDNAALKRAGQFLSEEIIAPVLSGVKDLTVPIVNQMKDIIRTKLDEVQEAARKLGAEFDNVIQDVTGQPRLAMEGADNVPPGQVNNQPGDNINQPSPTSTTPGESLKEAFSDPSEFARDIQQKPEKLWDKTAEDIEKYFNDNGYDAEVTQGNQKGTSGLSKQVRIKGHPEISNIQVHPGGGLHEGAYYKISTTTQGKIKVVDRATYKPTPNEKVKIIYLDF
jgi:hypothetical protein